METTRVPVRLGTGSYDVVLGGGLLDRLPTLLEPVCPEAAACVVITDSDVARHWGDVVRRATAAWRPTHLFTFPAGEASKTRETWHRLTDEMLETGIGRDSVVVALGGGVAGDLAGFVAATFHRGLPCVQIPTSLLAMIDSSVGGKTGVDTRHGKNLVGAFHQPRLVVADLDTLTTLPPRHLAAGLAEAVKHGAIADPDYLATIDRAGPQILEADRGALASLVQSSVEIKSEVVSLDEREGGRRSILNFGHTCAHAIEAISGYAVLHGEAVAAGMVLEARLGTALGITHEETAPRLESILTGLGLPVHPPRTTAADLIGAMRSDKKNRKGALRFSLLERIGRPARDESGGWTRAVSEKDLANLLEMT